MSAMTTGTSTDDFAVFVLAQLRCAGLRSRLLTAEIDSITTALSGDFIDTDDAIAWAHEVGALNLTIPSSAMLTAPSSATVASTYE